MQEENIKKIELDNQVQSENGESPKRPNKKLKKVLIGLGLGFGFFTIIAMMMAVYIGLQVKQLTNSAQPLIGAAKELSGAVKEQDIAKAKNALTQVKVELDQVNNDYRRLLPFKSVPLLGAYVKDGEHVIRAGFAGIDAGSAAISALEPNADLLGLKGGSKFVSGSAEDRIQTAVKTMEALTPKITEMAQNIELLKNEIDQIDPDRYPKSFRGYKIRDRIIDTKDLIYNSANLFVNAQPLLVNLPKILGEPDEKRYLILFQNDKELRPTGGFITAYAQFRFDGGKMILEKADDIYALDAAMKKKFSAPREILTFHKGVFTFNIRDSNLSPDFKLSMQQFEEMYETTSGREKIDGIIALDTHVLVEALRILGPSYIYDREFSAEIDPACDCPKAVYELEDYSTRPVGYVREARKDIIGVLLRELMLKALGVSPSQYWGKLFQMMVDEIEQKHILAYFKDNESQDAVESFNMAGRIMTQEETAPVLKYRQTDGWDYLHINDSNMAGAKANMFVSHEVKKEVTKESDSTIKTKLTIDYKNPYPASDCNLESGGLCLNAPLRNWLRIYVPKGSKLVNSKGVVSPKDLKPVSLETYDELEKTVFEGFLIVNPMGSAKVELEYTSPVAIAGSNYNILIQKQPGKDAPSYEIKAGSGKPQNLKLLKDTEISIKL